MQQVTLQEMISMHADLMRLSRPSKKMEEVIAKLEDQIHTAVMGFKSFKAE